MDVADSLYRQVISMWYSHLRNVVAKKTEISELDTILGKKDDDDLDKETIGKQLNLFGTYAMMRMVFTSAGKMKFN